MTVAAVFLLFLPLFMVHSSQRSRDDHVTVLLKTLPSSPFLPVEGPSPYRDHPPQTSMTSLYCLSVQAHSTHPLLCQTHSRLLFPEIHLATSLSSFKLLLRNPLLNRAHQARLLCVIPESAPLCALPPLTPFPTLRFLSM